MKRRKRKFYSHKSLILLQIQILITIIKLITMQLNIITEFIQNGMHIIFFFFFVISARYSILQNYKLQIDSPIASTFTYW